MPLMSSIRPVTWPELSGKTLIELPPHTIVSIEGIQYLRIENGILQLDYAGRLQIINKSLHDYVAKKIPKVIYGILEFAPLGF